MQWMLWPGGEIWMCLRESQNEVTFCKFLVICVQDFPLAFWRTSKIFFVVVLFNFQYQLCTWYFTQHQKQCLHNPHISLRYGRMFQDIDISFCTRTYLVTLLAFIRRWQEGGLGQVFLSPYGYTSTRVWNVKGLLNMIMFRKIYAAKCYMKMRFCCRVYVTLYCCNIKCFHRPQFISVYNIGIALGISSHLVCLWRSKGVYRYLLMTSGKLFYNE